MFDGLLAHKKTGTGPLAILIHGFPMDRSLWELIVPDVAGIRSCVAVDLPGFGKSPLGDGSMDGMADEVAKLISVGGESADVVGLSMGGYVALALAERYPDLVRSLVLADSRSEADTEEGRAGRLALAKELESTGLDPIADQMATVLPAPNAHPWVRRRIREMAHRSTVAGVASALVGMANRPDRGDVLDRLNVPFLAITGAQDSLTPPELGRAMAARASLGSFVEIEDAGHVTPLENPKAFVTALQSFWAT